MNKARSFPKPAVVFGYQKLALCSFLTAFINTLKDNQRELKTAKQNLQQKIKIPVPPAYGITISQLKLETFF